MIGWRVAVGGFVISVVALAHCGGSDSKPPPSGGNPEKTGQTCMNESECYPGVDAGALSGAVQCLNVTGGYCTHLCNDDSDCCKVGGECKTSLRQVCSPFENNGTMKMCFLSCEDADVQKAITIDASTTTDPTLYCQTQASAAFTCRSTGGGAQNRRVCLPGGTSPDAATD